jgi:hypothetical protein
MEYLMLNTGPLARQTKIDYLRRQVKIQRSEAVARTHDVSSALWECLHTFYPIAEFLAPIEVIGLAKLHKNFKLDKRMIEWYKWQFEKNIYDLMKSKGHPIIAQLMSTIPRPWPFVISGSIVLQALLSEKWESYDIDVYGNSDGLNELEKILRDNCYVCLLNPDSEDQYIQLEAAKLIKKVTDWHNYVRTSSNNYMVPCCVQIIELRDLIKNPADCVNSFDLSVVKNSWNGTDIFINDYESLLSRTAIVSEHIEFIVGAMGNGCGSFAGAFERLYQLQRNAILSIKFDRMNLNSSHAAVVSLFDRIFSRFLKYSKRGFLIHSIKRNWNLRDINTILDRLRRSPSAKKRWALFRQVKEIENLT